MTNYLSFNTSSIHLILQVIDIEK